MYITTINVDIQLNFNTITLSFVVKNANENSPFVNSMSCELQPVLRAGRNKIINYNAR